MIIREYFAEQLEQAKPITVEQLEEMRAHRRERFTPEEYEEALKASRLDTDELVGKTMLYYMLRTYDPVPQEGFNRSAKLEVLRVIDDELDRLAGKVRFDRMSNAIPIFEVDE
jgi:hypothetical protein